MTAALRAVVVVPTYNERENLERVVAGVRAHQFEALVVDDASPDGTGELAERLASDDDGIRVLHRTEKRGIGPAYAAGFEAALTSGATEVCQMDADLSHDPHDLPTLVEAVRQGADLAIGSRYVPGGAVPDWPLLRRAISAGGNWYARLMLGAPIRDITAGFRAWSPAGLAAADPATTHASGYAFQVEMAWRAWRAGCTVVEHPIVFRDRVAGESKMDGAIVREAARLVTDWGIRRMTGRLP